MPFACRRLPNQPAARRRFLTRGTPGPTGAGSRQSLAHFLAARWHVAKLHRTIDVIADLSAIGSLAAGGAAHTTVTTRPLDVQPTRHPAQLCPSRGLALVCEIAGGGQLAAWAENGSPTKPGGLTLALSGTDRRLVGRGSRLTLRRLPAGGGGCLRCGRRTGLDKLAPLDAALIDSGIEDGDSAESLPDRKPRRWGDHCGRSGKAPARLAARPGRGDFEFLHPGGCFNERIRSGIHTDLRRVLDDGRYNSSGDLCCSIYLAGSLEFGLSRPGNAGHAMRPRIIAHGMLDVTRIRIHWFSVGGRCFDTKTSAVGQTTARRSRPSVEGSRGHADPVGGDDLLPTGAWIV